MLIYEDLKKLAGVSGPCLTIIQPLQSGARANRALLPERGAPDDKPDAGVMTAIQAAKNLLTAEGFSSDDRDNLLRPIVEAVADPRWNSRKGTIVIFRSPDFFLAELCAEQIEPRLHLGYSFLVLPLLPALLSHHEFWLLGLSVKSVRLFRGSRNGMMDVALPTGLSSSLAADEAFDVPDHSLRGRSGAGPSVGSMKGVQFGTSSEREHQHDYLHDYFRAIDRAIGPILAKDPQPLILSAVSRELTIYREVNSYSPLLTGSIHGNPNSLGLEVLRTKANQIMSAYSETLKESLIREIEEAAGHGLVLTDPVAVAAAASIGRVGELIICPDALDFDSNEDVINFAALAVMRCSGKVFTIMSPRVTAGVTAMLRFHADDAYGGQAAQHVAVGTAFKK